MGPVRPVILAAFACLAVLAGPAAAHRLHAGVTEIAVNPRTGEMEVMHRVYAHDLMEAIGEPADAVGVLATADGQAMVGGYAAARFRMAGPDGTLLALDYVGAEIDGEFAWIYFAATPPADTSGFVVDNDLLADTFDDQVMMTNLRFDSQVRTAMQGPGRRAPVRVRFAQR